MAQVGLCEDAGRQVHYTLHEMYAKWISNDDIWGVQSEKCPLPFFFGAFHFSERSDRENGPNSGDPKNSLGTFELNH
jgi:hypothetical protein